MNDIGAEKFYVKVTSKKPIETVGLTQAFIVAQEELLRHNLPYSCATIYRDNGFGGLGPITLIVRSGGQYTRPADSIKHGYPFVAFYEGGNVFGKLNLDGTFVKGVA